jgi:hypothetical protein
LRKPTFRTNICVTGGYRKERTSLPKRVTGFSQLEGGLIEVSRNFILDVHTSQKDIQKFWKKTVSAHRKVLFFGPSKN